MEYQELCTQIESLGAASSAKYRQVLSLASIGGNAREEYREHLEKATTVQEFFDALYLDDELKFTKAWAAWAKLSGKDWLGRFEPLHRVHNVVFAGRGVPLEFLGNTLLVPTGGHGKTARIYVFEDGTFNESVATFFASLQGSFTCGGMSFEGIYDIYTSSGSVIFERWALNERGVRIKAAKLAEKYCRTG